MHLGPLISQAQWDRVQGYIQKGIDEGAKVVAGGLGAPEGLDVGFYVKPTVFSEVPPEMTIAQEEIFGPVITVIPYDDDDDAVRIANDSAYGLSGAVSSGSLERARTLRTGDPLDPATEIGPLVAKRQQDRVLGYIQKGQEEGAKVAIAAAAAENMGVDDPAKEGMHLGPLISQAQWDRVQGYIQKGIDEGAVVAAGGLGKPEGHETGYFVKPTVLANVTNDMTVAQEEIFGPVLSIIGYDDDDDAVRIANDSLYGLSGGGWSADQDRAIAVARRMRTGAVDVNGGSFNIAAPFGGYKQSGYGRENGPYGIEEFLQTKSLQL
jgi:acyl-CoA reductase-like NAD-dependent aldehyde dehydrogenase